MNKFATPVTAAAAALTLLCTPATAQVRDAARGASLLAEARNALGGDDKLAAVKTLQVRGDFKRMAGQNTLEGEIQLQIELPAKMRREEDTSAPGGGPALIRTEVLNGSEIWDENTGAGLGGGFGGRFGRGGGGRGADAGTAGGDARGGGRGPQIDPEQLRQLQLRARQADLARLLAALLLNTSGEVAWVGTAESPDGKADVLEIPGAGTETRLFLDVATHMPLMLTWQGAAPQGQGRRGGARAGGAPPDAAAPPAAPAGDAARQSRAAATMRLTLSDYKTVNGIKFPHLITRGVNDQTTEEWTVSNYRVNPSFKGDTFTRK